LRGDPVLLRLAKDGDGDDDFGRPAGATDDEGALDATPPLFDLFDDEVLTDGGLSSLGVPLGPMLEPPLLLLLWPANAMPFSTTPKLHNLRSYIPLQGKIIVTGAQQTLEKIPAQARVAVSDTWFDLQMKMSVQK
jgi:hypothetical protein